MNAETFLVETQSSTATLENSVAVSYEVKPTPYDPGISLLDVYRSYMLTENEHAKTYRQMFTTA